MRRSFPDFDNGPLFRWCLAKLAPLGAYDSSYCNDMSPSITIDFPDTNLRLFIDYKDECRREFKNQPSIVVYDDMRYDLGFESPREALREFVWSYMENNLRLTDMENPQYTAEDDRRGRAALKLLTEMGE